MSKFSNEQSFSEEERQNDRKELGTPVTFEKYLEASDMKRHPYADGVFSFCGGYIDFRGVAVREWAVLLVLEGTCHKAVDPVLSGMSEEGQTLATH